MKKREGDLENWTAPNVPDDLWAEILSRLPVKSLLRFRCVSSSWRALIADPNFVRLHLTNFSNNRLQSHLFGLQSHASLVECVVRCSQTLRATKLRASEIAEIDIALRDVVGSIDGLFMLKLKYWWVLRAKGRPKLLLWNPSIRKTRIIPPAPEFPKQMNSLEFGLGFDPVIKDYKQVTLVGMKDGGFHHIEVYTVGTNSWKTIEFEFQGEGFQIWCSGFKFPDPNTSFCLVGVLYSLAIDPAGAEAANSKWIALDPAGAEAAKLKLISFDLVSQVFACTRLPPDDAVLHSQVLTLTDCGSSLALVKMSSPVGSIWVLESLGGSLSWIRRHTFDTLFPENQGIIWSYRFLCLLRKDGNDLILLNRSGVVSHNLETHEEKIIRKTNVYGGRTWPYIESLILY